MIHPIVQEKLNALQELCKRYEVKTMYIFGSGGSNQLLPESNLDFLITFHDISVESYTDNYFDLHYQLEALFSRKIDLLTENSLSNPFFIKDVDSTKKLLYAA